MVSFVLDLIDFLHIYIYANLNVRTFILISSNIFIAVNSNLNLAH